MTTYKTAPMESGTWQGGTVEFPGGWAGDLVWSDGDLWVAWASCADQEPELLTVVDKSWPLRGGVALDKWRRISAETPFTVSLGRLGPDGLTDVRELGRSLHATEGPSIAALPDRAQPAVVWMERREGASVLMAAVGDGPVESIADGAGAKIGPRVSVEPGGGLTAVWQQWPGQEPASHGGPLIVGSSRSDESGGTWSLPELVSPTGQPAWAPAVVTDTDGGLWCTWDAWDGVSYQVLARYAPPGGGWGPVVQVSEPDGLRFLNFGPDIAAGTGRAWVVWARTPPWGVLSHRLNHNRSLHARLLTVEKDGSLSVSSATGRQARGQPGELPVTSVPFFVSHTPEPEFISPQAPRVRLAPDGNPVVFFRQFDRNHGYDFGWVTCAIRHNGDDWTAPMRISEGPGFPDSPYGVVPSGTDGLGWVLAAHAGESLPGRPVSRHRLVVEGADMRATTVDVQHGVHYALSASGGTPSPQSAPEAPVHQAIVGAQTYDLLYGDLHRHSAYSKCMSSVDGDLLDHWRWAHDVEGLDFYAITDHLEDLSYVEWRRIEDLAEALADNGRVLPLLGFELAIPPGHTNFFYTDQAVGHDLRVACLSSMSEDLPSVWSKLDSWVPDGKVVAIRHYHTGTHQGDDLIDTYAPKYEQVVEVIQTRYESPEWVQSLWRKGFRVGVVGSSDHSRIAPFPKVLAGLWLPEGQRTREGVLEGLKARRSFATNGVKMSVLLSATGSQGGPTLVMGEEGKIDGAPRLTANVAGTRTLDRVEFYRNELLLSVEVVGAAHATVEHVDRHATSGEHIYWVRVTQPPERPGSRPNYGVAYSSPVWVTV